MEVSKLTWWRDIIPNLNIVTIVAHMDSNSKFESQFMDGTKRELSLTFNTCLGFMRKAHKQEKQ